MKRALFPWVFACTFALALVAACACSDSDREESDPGRAELVGIVLDARTGAPVADAQIVLPGGREASTDDDGRFRVRDLDPGLAGEARAEADDGRAGTVTLRPLRAGRLEVVFHVGR